LLSFNIGVELGQLLVLVVLVPVLEILFRFVIAERMGTIILSALIAHTAWHWMIDRGERLKQFGWPVMNAALLATAMRWLMVILVLAGLAWLVEARRRRATSDTGPNRALPPDSDMANNPQLVIQSAANPNETSSSTRAINEVNRLR
jgi:hypothetical protein